MGSSFVRAEPQSQSPAGPDHGRGDSQPCAPSEREWGEALDRPQRLRSASPLLWHLRIALLRIALLAMRMAQALETRLDSLSEHPAAP